MKRTVISLITVVMLIMMMLPADIVAAREHVGHGQTATNETTANQTAISETAKNETIGSPLVADLDFSVCSSCSRSTDISVTFTDKSVGGVKPYEYYWDFGDGSNSTQENPRHRYASADNYTVTLTVTDSAGGVASTGQTVTLAPGANTESVSSNISATATTPTWPRCIDGCTANDVEINSVRLDIPAGNYTPGDVVTGNVSMDLYFHRQNTYCIVVVADLYEGEAPRQADWISTMIQEDGSNGVTFQMGTVNWTYGNLFEMRNILVMWSQHNPGGNCTADCSEFGSPSKCSQVASIIVHTPLVANFEADPVCYCHNTIFTDITTGGKTPYASWYWNFGDGSNSTEQNPTHHYAAYGNYTVTLTVTDSDSPAKSSSQSHNVTVYPTPTVNLTGDTSFSYGTNTTITANVAGGTPDYDYDWSASTADGTANDGSYTATGGGTVAVTVTDANNCTASDSVTVTVTSKILEITAASASKVYDGTPLTNSGYNITAGGLAAGDSLISVTVTGSQTVVGSSNNVPSNALIRNDGTNVTASYNITYVNGTLTVTPKTITITAASASKVYDGTPLTNSGYNITAGGLAAGDSLISVTVTGSQTVVGSSNNVPSAAVILDGAVDVTANYDITYKNGTLTVTKRTLEITADSNSKVYDGTPLTDSGYSITAGSLAPGDTLDSVTVTGSQTVVGSSNNVPSDAVIKNGSDVDVPANYDITYVNGTLTVTARPTPPPPTAAGGGCPTTKYLTVDWEGNNTTQPLYSNDCLAVDLLGPSPDISDNLFLERGTHAPVVDTRTYYLIVVRELGEIPPVPQDYEAIVVLNITPADAEFNQDIFLTVGLNETQLPQNVLNLTMDYYDDINRVWVPLEYEAGGPNGVAELTLSAPINHFSIYGVLAKLGPTTPIQPAHFVPSGLSITPSVEKIWKSITFVTKTGETVTITANIANDGGKEGTYNVVLKLNGQTVDTKTVTIGAGQSKQVSFTRSGLDYGQYDVNVAGLTGEFTTSRTITWWLIILIIIAIGLIIWGVIWGRRRRRRKAQQEA
jgi:PKD repeat protein